jgi:hypothetical protein
MNPACFTCAGQSAAAANHGSNKATPPCGECIHRPNTEPSTWGKPKRCRQVFKSSATKGSKPQRSKERQATRTAHECTQRGTRQDAKVTGQRSLRSKVAAVYTDNKGTPQRSLASRAPITTGGATSTCTPC